MLWGLRQQKLEMVREVTEIHQATQGDRGFVPNGTLIPTVYSAILTRLWPKEVHYIGNRVLFGMKPERKSFTSFLGQTDTEHNYFVSL